ncbi:MAG: DUF1175 family protein [Spirochaetes bacterium]|nr:DUF1175 family protein [Spirochaetota bacterium]
MVRSSLFRNSGIIVFLILTIFCLGAILDKRVTVRTPGKYLYADNLSTAFFRVTYLNRIREWLFPFKDDFQVEYLYGAALVEEMKRNDGFFLKSKWQTGELKLVVKISDGCFTNTLTLKPAFSDTDLDGFPDVAELDSQTDRDNFRKWFVSIAESQFYKRSTGWYKVHRDCAGLIVFAFKEALKKHNENWLKRFPYLSRFNIPDVQKYSYPDVPLLGKKVFRQTRGVFRKEDLTKDIFSPVANVNILMNHNLVFVGKEQYQFEKGDVLIFHRPQHPSQPYHSMIYSGEDEYLIYHTGDHDKGEVRKVKFKTLMRHPDETWHPLSHNRHFLGAFRFRIIT